METPTPAPTLRVGLLMSVGTLLAHILTMMGIVHFLRLLGIVKALDDRFTAMSPSFGATKDHPLSVGLAATVLLATPLAPHLRPKLEPMVMRIFLSREELVGTLQYTQTPRTAANTASNSKMFLYISVMVLVYFPFTYRDMESRLAYPRTTA
ncbi:hypothetical protein LTR56_007029 [Elasticomyces elasticus]|nr:hypothetical protein LTR56_007029 [Elasticomyces elasticus]KAK3664102.1 hypothetical protein LTR22_005066 [Elasticomyces elasticus]KAK4927671.1 hypothetical protein LTR49_005540 [Elasticomyces elasticus]KAK5767042.1 hypothetical protein LTS12_002807 [Elasticomyces elasticus]